MRIVLGLALILSYLAWILFHVLIKKDIKRYNNELYCFSFMILVWAAIYAAILH